VGVSPEVVLWCGRRRFGLAAVAFPFKQWLMVRATHNRSLAVLMAKMELQHPCEASYADSQAREAMVWRGGGGGSARERRWGILHRGHRRLLFIGGRVLAGS
jgi:hypothetical protein